MYYPWCSFSSFYTLFHDYLFLIRIWTTNIFLFKTTWSFERKMFFFFFFKNKIMEIFVKTVYTCTYIHYQRFSCIAEKPNISHNLTRNTGLNTHHLTWCCSVQLTIHVHSILYTNPSILNCLYMTACIKCLIINFHEISL